MMKHFQTPCGSLIFEFRFVSLMTHPFFSVPQIYLDISHFSCLKRNKEKNGDGI